jgi:hypothetical protein
MCSAYGEAAADQLFRKRCVGSRQPARDLRRSPLYWYLDPGQACCQNKCSRQRQLVAPDRLHTFHMPGSRFVVPEKANGSADA